MIRFVRPLFRFAKNIPVVVRIGMGALFTVLILYVYRRYSFTYALDSDFANPYLQADQMVHGNILLSHWYMTSVSFYTTDVFPLALGMIVRGVNPVVLHEVPVLVYGAMLIVATILTQNHSATRKNRNWQGIVVVIALLGFPAEALASRFLMGPGRTTTILYVLIAYLILDSSGKKRDFVSPLRIGLFGFVLFFAMVGDTFPQYVVVVPVVLVSLLRVYRQRDCWKEEATLSVVTVASAICAKVFLKIVALIGGFVVPEAYFNDMRIVSLQQLGANAFYTLQCWQMLQGCDFWGQPIDLGTIVTMLRVVLATIIAYCFFVVLRLLRRDASQNAPKPYSIDRVSAYLGVGMVVNFVAYTVTSLNVGIASSRYMIPFVVFGAVLAGRCITHGYFANRKIGRIVLIGVVAGAALSLPWFYLAVKRPYPYPPARRLGKWLASQNLRDGYGTWWCSTVVTVETQNQVRVRSINDTANGIEPKLFGVDERWYVDAPAYFVVLDGNFPNVTQQKVVWQFGKPTRIAQYEGYTILIYNRDIAPRLANKPLIRP